MTDDPKKQRRVIHDMVPTDDMVPTPNTPVSYDPAPTPEEPENPPPAPPPEDLLASLANVPKVQTLGNQGAGSERLSRTDMENGIRQVIQECLDFSRAFVIHVSYLDETDQIQHRSFNYFMPVENLDIIGGEVQKFLTSIRPDLPEQLLPPPPEESEGKE